MPRGRTAPPPGGTASCRAGPAPLPGIRQGRPRGTRSRPRTEKAPLGSRSRAWPPSTTSTVPCIHTTANSSGARPTARDSRHAPGPPSAWRRSCPASTLSGGDRGSRTAPGPPEGGDSTAAAMLRRRHFPANSDGQRGLGERQPIKSAPAGTSQWSGLGVGPPCQDCACVV